MRAEGKFNELPLTNAVSVLRGAWAERGAVASRDVPEQHAAEALALSLLLGHPGESIVYMIVLLCSYKTAAISYQGGSYLFSTQRKKQKVRSFFFFYLLWTECRAMLHRVLWSYFQMLTYIWFCSMLVQFAFFFNYEKCIVPSKEHLPAKYFLCYPRFPSDQSQFLIFSHFWNRKEFPAKHCCNFP